MALKKSIYTLLTIARWESLNHMEYKVSALRKVHGKLALNIVECVVKQPGLKRNHLTHIFSLTVHVLVSAKMYEPAKSLLRELVRMRIGTSSVFGALMNTYSLCKSSPAVFDLLIRVQLRETITDGLETFFLMGFRGFNPSIYTCNMLLNALVKERRVDSVWFLVKEMLNRGIHPDSCTFNILINLLGSEGKLNKARYLMKQMEECGYALSVVTYNSMLKWCCKKGRYKVAYELIDQMVSKGIEADVFTFNTILDDVCRNQSSAKGYLLLKRMKKSNEVSYNTLINGFFKEGKVEVAEKIFDEMVRLKFSPNLATYNSMIDGYSRVGMFDGCLKLLDRMKEVGIQPNEISYGAFLNGLIKHSKFDLAQSILTRMETSSVAIGVVAYTSMIEKVCKEGFLPKSVEILDIMKKNNVSPDVVTYSVLINGFMRFGFLRNAKELLSKLFKNGLKPNDAIFGSLVCNCSKHGCIAEAIKFLVSLKRCGHACDGSLSNTVVSALCKNGRFEEAIEFMSRMNIAPNAPTLECFLTGFANEGNVSKAFLTFDQMIKSGFSPTYFAVGNLVKCLYRSGNIVEARNLISKFQLTDVRAYNTLISELCKMGKLTEALSLFDLMVEMGVLPDVYTYTIVLSGLSKHQKLGSAFDVLNKVIKQGNPQQSVVAYTTLIDALFKSDHSKGALSFWNKMKNEGLSPDTTACNVMLNGMLRMGKLEHIDGLLERIASPSLVTFNTILHWCSKEKNIVKASKTYNLMKEEGFKPDKLTSRSLILLFMNMGMIDLTFKFLKSMLVQGVEVDLQTFHELFNTLKVTKRIRKIFHLMDAMESVKLIPDSIVYESVFCVLRNIKALKEAHAILHVMMDQGITPHLVLYHSLVKNLCRVGDIKRAFEVREEMEALGICSTQTADTILVRRLAQYGSLQSSTMLFDNMLKKNLIPDDATFTALMRQHCIKGDLEGARRLKNTMEGFNMEPNVVVYNVLIEGHIAGGDFASAIGLYEEMKKRRICPQGRTFLAMIDAVLNGDMRPEMAEMLLKDLQGRGIISEMWKAGSFRGLKTAKYRLKFFAIRRNFTK